MAGALTFVGCPGSTSPTLPPATPGGGFILETFYESPYSGIIGSEGNIAVQANWQGDLAGASGNPSQITTTTNALALAALVGARAPAIWQFTWLAGGPDPGCAGVQATGGVEVGGMVDFVCYALEIADASAGPSAFVASPNPIVSSAPPSSLIITGQGFSSSFGMPMVQYYAMDGTLVDQENATSVSQDGTSISGPVGDVSQLPAGTYVGFISNAGSGGSWDYVGTVGVSIVTGASGTGTVTISGSEQTYQYDACNVEYPIGDNDWMYCEAAENYQASAWAVDNGEVTITVNGFTADCSYSSYLDTAANIASCLANQISGSNAGVWAWASNGVITLTAESTGVSTDYALSADSWTDNTSFFSNPSFYTSSSGQALTGGH